MSTLKRTLRIKQSVLAFTPEVSDWPSQTQTDTQTLVNWNLSAAIVWLICVTAAGVVLIQGAFHSLYTDILNGFHGN